MPDNQLVSIVIPIFNVENYLDEAIQSIQNQSYKNLQIILVNDGSTDSSYDIAKKYAKDDNRIELLSQENKGLSGARNTGLKNAKGKYVYFFDSDDYLEPLAIEKCVLLLKKDGADLVRFGAKIHPDSAQVNLKRNAYKVVDSLNNKTISIDEYLRTSSTFTSSVPLYIYKMELLRKNNLFFYEGILHEDELWTTQILLKANKISFLSESFFLRRYRENSIMISRDNQFKKGNDLVQIGKELVKHRSENLTKEKYRLLEKRILRNVSVGILQAEFDLKKSLSLTSSLKVSKIKVLIFIYAKRISDKTRRT